MVKFERGDIVLACLKPTTGSDLKMDVRPCLVLSTGQFNKLGLQLIAPITEDGNYARFGGFTVNLMGTGTKTQGVVLAYGIRSVDLAARQAVKVEKAPTEIVNEVLAIMAAILE